jgi:hypothetical protein
MSRPQSCGATNSFHLETFETSSKEEETKTVKKDEAEIFEKETLKKDEAEIFGKEKEAKPFRI